MVDLRDQVEIMMGRDEDDLPVSSKLVRELEELSSADLHKMFYALTGHGYEGRLFVRHIEHIGDILPRCERESIEWIMRKIHLNIQMVLFRFHFDVQLEAVRVVLTDDLDKLDDALHKLRRGELE